MPRSSEAYLVDIIESRDTIEFALAGIDVEGSFRVKWSD